MRLVVAILLMLGWVSCVLLSPGCGPSEADASAAAAPRPLSFSIINQSGGEIRSIGVEGANYPMAFSPITKGDAHTISAKSLELPETLTVHWSDRHGERFEGRVNVWSELGPTYSGPVNLTIDMRNNVNLSGG